MAKKNDVPEEQPQKSVIAPLTLDFGRADLNMLAAKVNEIISSLT